MKKNYYTVITGTNVVLVSYKKEHVAKYHEWMKSKELQKLTASEPLTIYEEYKMQNTWLEDKNKCTFIVLDKQTYWETRDEVESMIGDTNLFFSDSENPTVAEAEIMIADESFRGKKRGYEAMLLMLHYGISELKVTKYIVKIAENNEICVNMFKKIGFEYHERSDVFKEITLIKDVTPVWKNSIEINVNFIKIKNCDIKGISAVFAQRRAQQQKEKERKEKEAKENDDNDKKIKEEIKNETQNEGNVEPEATTEQQPEVVATVNTETVATTTETNENSTSTTAVAETTQTLTTDIN